MFINAPIDYIYKPIDRIYNNRNLKATQALEVVDR